MNIVYILTLSDTIGGVQIHVRDICSELIKKGHSCTVLVGGHGVFCDELEENNIPYISIPTLVRPISPVRDFLALLRIIRALRELKPDLISLHTSKAGILGRIAARIVKTPVIFTAHGWAFTDGVPVVSRKFYLLIEKMFSGFASKIITVSNYDKEIAVKNNFPRSEDIIPIHNGMHDIEKDYISVPSVSPPNLIMVARFAPQKDHITLFKALSKLKDLDWSLTCVGDGNLQPNMEKLAGELGIYDRIHFVGLSRNVREYLSRSQIFLLISNWEGFPRSILEAMRAGLPVIATDVGGVSESVIDKKTGFLVPRGDVNSLVVALRTLILNSQLREEYGKQARYNYEKYFTFHKMLEKTFKVYENVISDNSTEGSV